MPKYTAKHIAAVTKRINEYGEVLNGEGFVGLDFCDVCETTAAGPRTYDCDSCLFNSMGKWRGCANPNNPKSTRWSWFRLCFGHHMETKAQQRNQLAHLTSQIEKCGYEVTEDDDE